jgi:hypothetical protein
LISSFDDEIGYVAGLPPGTKTIATAFKRYGELIGTPYKAFCKHFHQLAAVSVSGYHHSKNCSTHFFVTSTVLLRHYIDNGKWGIGGTAFANTPLG